MILLNVATQMQYSQLVSTQSWDSPLEGLKMSEASRKYGGRGHSLYKRTAYNRRPDYFDAVYGNLIFLLSFFFLFVVASQDIPLFRFSYFCSNTSC